MINFIIQRALWSIFVVFMVLTAVFFLTFGIGQPAAVQLGPNATPAKIEEFEARYGLDRPIAEQFAAYLGARPCLRVGSRNYDGGRGYCGLLQGDLGESLTHQDDVAAVIALRLPRTLLLSGLALLFELVIGVFAGALAAVCRNTWIDTGIIGSALLGISLPTFVTGPLFLLILCANLGWFPVGGYGNTALEHLHHAILPAFALAVVGAATYTRIMRSEMVETLNADYVRTARAKGIGELQIIVSHAMRNALLPIVTLLGLQTAFLVTGAIITEHIFAWPGMGSLAIEAIASLDIYMVTAVVLITSITVQAGNLIADIAVARLDPRIRLRR
ncbi:MAG: ABC transporter permease [Myxococcota bacterium]